MLQAGNGERDVFLTLFWRPYCQSITNTTAYLSIIADHVHP